MFDSLKNIFGGNKKPEKNKNNIYHSECVEEYEYDEMPVKICDDSNIIKIKTCSLEDYRDATDIAVLVEAGYLVIATTIDLERDIDEDYSALLNYLKDKLEEINGNLVMISSDRIMALPQNAVIEKLVNEPDDVKSESSVDEDIEIIEEDVL